jgi:tRNA dimethylallyltransferase
MDIGTAKPAHSELDSVKHHLINVLNPDEKFSAGLFKESAKKVIDKLHESGKVPIIVGGTGLYIRSLTQGLFEGPGADESLRNELKEEEEARGPGHLYKRLGEIDPEAAGRIEPNDLRRIIRALEVSINAKRGISDCQSASTYPMQYNFIKIGLMRERQELYDMIDNRVDAMMEQGLLEETRRLLDMKPNNTALQALGYKEMALHIHGEIDLQEAVRLTKKRTRTYAKRQFTWFKKEPHIHWVDITGLMDHHDIFDKTINNVDILKKIIYSS